MKKIFKILPVVILSFLLVAWSFGEKKPDKNELQNAFEMELPGYVLLDNFDVKILENLGNKVEPRWGSRFEAAIKTKEPLYEFDQKKDGITFLVLKNEKGNKIKIYGKIYSILYQGKWKHSFDVEGNPIRNLGILLNQFKERKVLIRGSQEEKDYFSQFKETYDRFSAAIKNKETLVGKAWSQKDTWPCKIKFYGFKNNSGDFEGEVHWLNLDAIHKISGKLSYGKLFFQEIEFIKKGKAALHCKYYLPLLQRNNVITGEWVCGSRGGVELSIPKQ